MQRKSSILGPNIVDFGTHFDISSFPGPNMQHTLILRPANDRLFTKMVPKMDPKMTEFGCLFSLLFWLLIWTPISTMLSPKCSQNGTQKAVFFETSDLAKV